VIEGEGGVGGDVHSRIMAMAMRIMSTWW